LSDATSTAWVNYTLDPDEQNRFIKNTIDIGIDAYASATNTPTANVSIQTINYTWDIGKIFTEPQDLFIKVKIYDFNPLLQSAVLYINASNSTTTGGWGETFNFTVHTRDRFGRNVTVFAWHLKSGAGEEYAQIANDTCINCADLTLMNFTFDYNGSDIEDWTFKFNATNLDGDTQLTGSTFTVEKDDVNATINYPPNNQFVNRSNTTVFSVSVYDKDNRTYISDGDQGKGEIAITIVGLTTFETSPPAIDAENGYINRSMVNGGGGASDWCLAGNSFDLGQHAWRGGILSTSNYVKANITNALNFTLIGEITNTIQLPNETINFTRGQTITFDGSVEDDCGLDVTDDASILYTFQNGEFVSNCTAGAGTGNGRCTITTNDDFPTGLFNVTMETNLTGYYNDTDTNISLLFLGTVSQLLDPRNDPDETLIPWGQTTINFSVNVSNNDNNTVNITLYIRNASTEFVPENNTFCANCSNNSLFIFVTQKNFTPFEITLNPWEYKFNSTDSGNVGLNDTITQSINITANNINFSDIGGDGSFVNRSDDNINEEVNLSAIIFDMVLQRNTLNQSTPNLTIDMINISVYNGSIFETNESQEVVNHTLTYYRAFNPSCRFEAGNQDWYIESNSSTNYTDNTSSTFKVEIFGDVNATYLSPTGSLNFEAGNNIQFQGELIDDCRINISNAQVVYRLITNVPENHRPIDSNVQNGTQGFANNITDAFDNSLNDTTTNATITSNGTGAENFSLVNYTFEINASLENATLFITTARNESAKAGSIYIYNFTSDRFIHFVTPISFTNQTNETFISTAIGLMNASGHVIIQANATGNDTNTSTIYLLDTYIATRTFYTCDAASNTTGNLYGCTFDTTGKVVGEYEVTMVASKSSHNNGTSVADAAAEIISPPALTGADVTVRDNGWGVNRTFFITVNDNTGDTVTVKLFHDIGSGYVEIGEQSCTSCSSTVLEFERSYACDDIRNDNTFLFNSTDTEGNSDNITTSTGGDYVGNDDTFNIEKDSILINITEGNETNATLNRRALFVLRVFDLDNQTYNLSADATITFNVTEEGAGSDFFTTGTNDTNGSGHAPFNFLPRRVSTVEKQVWKGFTAVQTCYLFNESQEFNVTTLTNVPRVDNNSADPNSGGWGIERYFTVNVNDSDNNASVYVFESTTTSGPWTELGTLNYSFQEDEINSKLIHDAEGSQDDSLNYTETINLTALNATFFNITIENLEAHTIYFNLTLNDIVLTTNNSIASNSNFTLNLAQNITINHPGNNTINISIINHTSFNLTPVNWRAYIDYRLEGVTRKLNFSVNLTITHDLGIFFYKFNASNDVGNQNETPSIATNNFTVLRDTLTFNNLVGNNSISNRLGEQTLDFTVRVFDEDNNTNASNVNVSFTLTLDGSTQAVAFKNLTNASGHSQYTFNATCSPKYEVGDQVWKIVIDQDDDYFALTLDDLNFSVRGDILLDFTKPDGTTNFTQEDNINFLGATTDDCGDAIATTVNYTANTTEETSFFTCDTPSQVGANAFSCDFATTITTTKGYYNTTMTANRTNHYDNFTVVTGEPGLFFLNPIKKLESPSSIPTSGGWGTPNWQFNVSASSGDPDADINISVFMDKATPNPPTKCENDVCNNQTNITCLNCIEDIKIWFRNFSSDDPAGDLIGQWFFQFKMNDTDGTSTSGTAFTFDITKDNTNISYNTTADNSNGAGNGTTVIINSQPQLLRVRVFDRDKDNFNVTPAAEVSFKLVDTGYSGGSKIIGSNTTNSTGHAQFLYNHTQCSGYVVGEQLWQAEINSSETNYGQNTSELFNITLDLTGCEASVVIDSIFIPTETFQYQQFVVNATVNAFISDAEDVNATLIVPSEWSVVNQTAEMGTVTTGEFQPVSWIVNATTFGRFNISIDVNSSNAGNTSKNTEFFIGYKQFPPDIPNTPIFPVLLNGTENVTLNWACDAGVYRVATLNTTVNTSDNPGTTLRVLTYDGTQFVDVLHSYDVATDNELETYSFSILEGQLNVNETGFCAIEIRNIGDHQVNITNAYLEAYSDTGHTVNCNWI